MAEAARLPIGRLAAAATSLADRAELKRAVLLSLRTTCSRILAREEIDSHERFYDMGGDSFSLIEFMASALNEFGIDLTAASAGGTASLDEFAELVVAGLVANGSEAGVAGPNSLDRRAADRPDPAGPLLPPGLTTEVPLLANRHAYFFRLRRNLEHWNLCTRPLALRELANERALQQAVQRLVDHHDGLRLQLSFGAAGWRQEIVPPENVAPLLRVELQGPVDSPGFKASVERTISDVRDSFRFPGDLFKVAQIVDSVTGRSVLCFVAHHILLDAHSFRLVLEDFFHLYRAFSTGDRVPALPAKTMSLVDYCCESTRHWLTRRDENLTYWLALPWGQITPIPNDWPAAADSNWEAHTRAVVTSLTTGAPSTFVGNVNARSGYHFVDVLFASVARAYSRWTGQPVLHLAAYFHGREPFREGIDLSRTVGWLSETVPLLLRPNLPLGELLQDTRSQIEQANRRGRSYGVLKHLDDRIDPEIAKHPEPEMSLNVLLPGMRRPASFLDVAEPMGQYEVDTRPKPTTERGFLISGGAYFKDEELQLSWDYSSRHFKDETIRKFGAMCIASFSETLDALGGVRP
jgi:hypothetical protein